MTTTFVLNSTQSPAKNLRRAAPSGFGPLGGSAVRGATSVRATSTSTDGAQFWQLKAGHALSFYAHGATELHITQGRIWATLDGPHSGTAYASGDLVLRSGDCLTLRRGQRIVVESWGRLPQEAARLLWRDRPAATPQAARRSTASLLGGWLAALYQRLGALGRRTAGFGRLGCFGRFGRFGAQGRLQCHAGPGCHGVG